MYSGWSCWCGDALFFLRLKETLDRLAAKLEAVYNASGGKKINIISHSMGGLLVKCFMCLHSDVRLLHIAFWSFFFPHCPLPFQCVVSKAYALQYGRFDVLYNVCSIMWCLLFHRFLRSMWRIGLQLLHHSRVSDHMQFNHRLIAKDTSCLTANAAYLIQSLNFKCYSLTDWWNKIL